MLVLKIRSGKKFLVCRNEVQFPEIIRKKKCKIRCSFELLAFFWMIFFSSSHANGLQKIALETQSEKADLVAIASSGAEEVCSVGKYNYACVKLTNINLLKNKNANIDNIYLILDVGIPESEISCCEPGGMYLLFLRNFSGNFYAPLNGSYSVLKVEPQMQ